MNCHDFEANIDALIGNSLDDNSVHEMHQHSAECSDCANSMRQHAAYLNLIKQWQEPNLSEHKKAHLLASLNHTTLNKTHDSNKNSNERTKPSVHSFASGFAAASFLAVSVFIGSQFLNNNQNADLNSYADFDSRLNQEITLVINVADDIPNAELHLDLPAELSVVGQEYLSQVNLPLSLKKGRNTIVIPVQLEEFALYANDVVVDASLIYKNSKKDFALDLDQHLDLDSPQTKNDELIRIAPAIHSNKTV